jgi:YidC/Oxa1 family membrane protein insertase
MNPWELIGQLYNFVVYRPELNILEFYYKLTGDIGISIALFACTVNLLMWPLYFRVYLNGQKSRYLQPKIKEIQEKYKADQQEMIKKLGEFNKHHGINNAAIFYLLLAQIAFATGLYTLTNQATQGKELTGLYSFIFGRDSVTFSSTAFGFLNIGQPAHNFLVLPILNAIFSYLLGMYTFRWGPKLPPVPKTPKAAPKLDKDGKEIPALFDPEQFAKTLEIQTIYFFPIMLFIFNYNLSISLNIYFAAVNFMALVRQIYISNYYAGHTRKFVADIAATDPDFAKEVGMLEFVTDVSSKTKRAKAK